MKHFFLSLIVLASGALNGESHDHEEIVSFDVPVKSLSASDRGYVSPDSVPTGRLTVVPMEVKGFDGEKGEKLEAAFELLEEVVNSEEFKERILNFTNKKGERAFNSNKNLTNEEIYTLFMNGEETLQPGTISEMNFWLRLYHKPWSKVIGYTSAKTNVISINWKYFKSNTLDNVAANLAHEWVHKLGFTHKSASEHDSVPYGIGYIVGDLIRARLSAGTAR